MKIGFWAVGHEYLKSSLGELGDVIDLIKYDMAYAPKVQVLVVASKPILNRELLDNFPDLKLVVRVGSGFDNIDLKALRERGIKFIRVPEGNREAVADHTLLLIIGLLRRIKIALKKGEQTRWNREGAIGEELRGKIVGLVGYGNVGMEVALRLVSMGSNVLCWDPFRRMNPILGVHMVSYDTLLSHSDIISFHIQDYDNGCLFDKETLTKVKKGVLIVNTSRGALVDTYALIEGLRKGVIGGLALDVIEGEPEPEMVKEFEPFDNVIITPHVAGHSYEAYNKMKELIIRKIKYAIEI